MALYIEVLNPKNDRLFQKPQRDAKWFNIHNFTIDCFYEMKPIGKNLIGDMLKKLCKAADQPLKWTNHSIRATGITNLKASGVEDRAVINVSGKFYLIH